MTTPATTQAPAGGELDLGHPVRSFVVVLVAVGLVLLALQWTGAVHPQVRASGEGTLTADDGGQTFVVEVRNHGALPVRVVDVTWPVRRMVTSEIGLAPSTDAPGGGSVSYALEPFEPFTLEGGATRWIGIGVTPECFAWLGSPEIRVRTASRLHRSIPLDQSAQDVHGGC